MVVVWVVVVVVVGGWGWGGAHLPCRRIVPGNTQPFACREYNDWRKDEAGCSNRSRALCGDHRPRIEQTGSSPCTTAKAYAIAVQRAQAGVYSDGTRA